MMKFKEYLLEKFKDLGKLSDDELKKGQRLSGDDDDFTLVDARVFAKAIIKIKANDIARGEKAKGLDGLSIYSVGEYGKMKCYLGKNNSSGYAIKKTDLVSVFSSQQSSANSLVKHAISNGAKTLDCFAERVNGKISGALFGLYSKHGFKINKSMNDGKPGEAYSIQNGVSSFVDSAGNVDEDNKTVVIFMKL